MFYGLYNMGTFQSVLANDSIPEIIINQHYVGHRSATTHT